ncbi:MAG: dimethylglycine catabolism protein DgcA [Pseudomonadota bacterium]|jgi:2,4-dienoyl-CoA reductase-like NADH-dependent reductase (Old Yellow Enzyme family)
MIETVSARQPESAGGRIDFELISRRPEQNRMSVQAPERPELLFSPLDVGPMRVRNRVMMSGHALLYGEHGTLSQRHIDYYRERAAGGVALLVTEQQAAHPSGANYLQGCRAYDPRSVPWYAKLSEAVHAEGAKVLVQLFCGGAQGSGTLYTDDWQPLWAPSPIASTQFHEQPKVMSEADIQSVIDGFVQSALHAQAGGCDGVEIHAAHSQLLGMFLSPAFNHRNDRYGGSVADRARIVLEIGESIRTRVGAGFAVGLRLSIDERLAGGAGISEDEFLRQLEVLAAAGLFDFYDLSAGGYFAKHISVTPMTSDEPFAFLAPAAGRARVALAGRGRVFVVGRIRDPATARQVIESGAADMVAITRGQIADPEFVRKVREGREDEINRCVGANVCIRRVAENNHVVCALNPATGRESQLGRFAVQPRAHEPGRILVVGAGPAGLRAAAAAARRGHSVRVIDRADQAGGRLRHLASLPGRSAWKGAIANLLKPVEAGAFELELSVELASRGALLEEAQRHLLAIGASFDTRGYSAYRPERASVPAAAGSRVLGMDEAIEQAVADPTALGNRVLIVDDGYDEWAAGLAEWLATAGGAAVTIASPRAWWGESLARTYDAAYVMPRLRRAGVTILTQHFIERIEPGLAWLYELWLPAEERSLEADTVVLSLGRSTRSLSGFDDWNWTRVGDCLAPRSIEAVIYEGEAVGRTI